MSNPTSTRAYTISGFRIELVREPGVKLAERPQLRDWTAAAPILAQYIGESPSCARGPALLSVPSIRPRARRNPASAGRGAGEPLGRSFAELKEPGVEAFDPDAGVPRPQWGIRLSGTGAPQADLLFPGKAVCVEEVEL